MKYARLAIGWYSNSLKCVAPGPVFAGEVGLLLLGIAVTVLAGNGEGHPHHTSPQVGWTADASAQQLVTTRFELVNGEGRIVSERDYRGRYLLLGFGFSHCHHVCPTTLRDWAAMMADLPPEKAAQLQVVMVSLDPERDSPQLMDRYSKQFDPRFQGLSGSPAQIAGIADNFRVSYHRVPVGEGYQINHSSMSYLISPEGEVVDYFGFATPSAELAAAIASHIH